MSRIVSAIFVDLASTTQAMTSLRRAGIADAAIALATRDPPGGCRGDTEAESRAGGEAVNSKIRPAVIPSLVSGLAARPVHDATPFLAAGMLAEAFIPGAARRSRAGAGSAGRLATALARLGVEGHDALLYESQIRAGRTWLGVDSRLTNVAPLSIAAILEGRIGG